MVVSGVHESDAAKAAAADLVAGLASGTAAPLAGAGRHGVIEQPAALAALISELCASLES